ncbi:MAG: hypothetical protein HY220_03875 [Candidatus Sungbacteria bacterium]|uniref:Sphingomyelin synthase-like domain-containing protein n=1 Tax=Candidatus Sungiibacteriota bacterium TaxID=2750080 RepID=A0A9D6QU64_9BACT|nr:hypothetical protein [Candidatus Sungbacteria bacterium]
MKGYQAYLRDKSFLLSAFFSLCLLLLMLVINFYAGTYATREASNPVTDIVLDNIRVYDVDGVFIYGAFLFWIFIGLVCLHRPQRIPFTLKSISLFILIRSIFITLTHIGPFPTHTEIASSLISRVSFGGDLFFSGHTGLPFLMALIFWETPLLHWTFILLSLVFGVVVLLGHLHYSIDVLSAFFITYSIYKISAALFKKDRAIFLRGL